MNPHPAPDSGDVTLLIRRARANPELFGSLVQRYHNYLRLSAACELDERLAARVDAEDVAQDTVLAATKKFPQFKGNGEETFATWLAEIHRNTLREIHRKHIATQKRSVNFEYMHQAEDASLSLSWHRFPNGSSTPSKKFIKGENAVRLADALASLPKDQATVIRLRFIEGLSLKEIARRIQRSRDAATGLLRRGLAAMRKRLNQENWKD